MTEIENFLFTGNIVHCVVRFSQDHQSIRLRISPYYLMRPMTEAVFEQARITSIETYSDDGDSLNMPWDIIGLDSYKLEQDRWQFVLHCDGIEYCFESRWPEVVSLSNY